MGLDHRYTEVHCDSCLTEKYSEERIDESWKQLFTDAYYVRDFHYLKIIRTLLVTYWNINIAVRQVSIRDI